MLTQLGEILRKLRIENGQVLKEMADTLGISSANLSSIENKKSKPKKQMIEDIICKYGLTPASKGRFGMLLIFLEKK